MRKSAVAVVVAVAGVAAVLATPADAKPRRALSQNQFNQVQAPGQNLGPASDPTGVYRDGRLIGRDPDPAVRAQIQAYFGHGGAP